MRHIDLFALLVFVSATSLLTARTQDPQRQAAPIFRADSRLVRVSVVVQDDRGQPVPGLTASDFEVRENGQAQSVSLFAAESSTLGVRSAAPSETYSNRVDGAAARGVTLILYDRLNTSHEHQAQARAHIIKYLKELRPDGRVGFYVLESDSIRVVHPFTRDTESLLNALQQTQPRSSMELVASDESLLAPPESGDATLDGEIRAWVRRADDMIKGYYRERRVNAAIKALESLARHLAGFQGRKNVIWISDGFPLRFSDGIMLKNAEPEVRAATRALNDADMAIYPVSAIGLPGAFSTQAAARRQEFLTVQGAMAPHDSSQLIAERTGGRAFFNTNDLGSAIKRASEDTALTYVLGYYPRNMEWDGEFREIDVKVRRPNVDVHHRKGYFAIAPSAPMPVSRDDAMFDALSEPLEASGIGLGASVVRDEAGARPAITIRVDPDPMSLTQKGDFWEGAVAIAIAQVLPDMRLFKSVDTLIPLRFDANMRRQLSRDGLRLTHRIDVRDDAHQIRVCVMDPATGALGTVTIPASALRKPRER